MTQLMGTSPLFIEVYVDILITIARTFCEF